MVITYSVPGKVFILGEYAVLAGQPAWVAAVAGRFRLTLDSAAAPLEFASGSPASRLLNDSRVPDGARLLRATLSDDWRGEGGFGGSSAEFALVYRAIAHKTGAGLDWESVWRRYIQLHANEPVPPSGADLALQWKGGIQQFDPVVPEIEPIDLSTFRWLIFSAAGLPGRKVATHEHLAKLQERSVTDPRSDLIGELSMIFAQAADARRDSDARALGSCLSRYAEALAAVGLESEAAAADRVSLLAIPGVLGVKGAGAMLADAVVVLLDGRGSTELALKAARARGLRLVSDGLPILPGIREE